MEELKEMVIKNLDSQGVLDAIRAQLRASVFQAILSQEGKPGVSVPANDSGKIMETERGQACAELLRDFMARNSLAQTVSVFAAETRLPAEQMDRRALEMKLKIKGRPDQPLLFSVLDRLKEKLAMKASEEQAARVPAKPEPLAKPAAEPVQQVPKPKESVPPLTKPIPERNFQEPPAKVEPPPAAEKPSSLIQNPKPDLKPLARAPALAPLDRKPEPEEKKFDFDPKKPASLNLERKFAQVGLGRAAVFEDDNPGAALPDVKKKEEPRPQQAKWEEPKSQQAKREEPKPQQAKREEPKPQGRAKVVELPSGSDEEVEDDIEEDIEHEDFEVEVQPAKGPLLESMGTSSLGVDASVDSLALEDYDHVEKVAKATK